MFDPMFLTEAQARTFIRIAVVAASASVIFSIILLTVQAIQLTPWVIGGTILVAALALGMYRGNVVSAAVLCVFQAFNMVQTALLTGHAPRMPAIAFFVVYLGGAAGTATLRGARNSPTKQRDGSSTKEGTS
jgi:hypothetical protein